MGVVAAVEQMRASERDGLDTAGEGARHAALGAGPQPRLRTCSEGSDFVFIPHAFYSTARQSPTDK